MTSNRLRLIDTYRGLTIISMIIFHACWDLYYFNMGITADLLFGKKAYIWQQSICYSFILLSGFCFSYGHHHIKRGLMSLGGGILISIVTALVIPDERDLFGVLWMLGSSMLIMTMIDKIIPKNRKWMGFFLIISLVLFIITRNINSGFLGFEGINICRLPINLYKGYFMTYIGFMDPGFYSSDYFSLIPWLFLFMTGYFIQKILLNNEKVKKIMLVGIKPLEVIGRHSFIIYMSHQVILYGIVYLISLIYR